MPTLYGADQVRSQRRRLDSAFESIDGTDIGTEALSHFSRYLCICLAGFAEQSLKDLVSQHARNKSAPRIHSFVENRIGKVWGINRRKLQETLTSFDSTWWDELERDLPEELEALNSVGRLRDSISHGGGSGISLLQVKEYQESIYRLIDHLCELLDPND